MTAPLTGRVAVITGGSRGIGAATAGALAERGAAVVVSGRDGDRLQAVVKDLEGRGVSALGVVADVARREDADRLVDATKERFGRIDVLVNNAGMIRDGLLVRMRDEDWDRVIEVDLTSVFRLTRALTHQMMRRRYGRIINITSIVGVTGNPGQANYCAAKAGMIGFSKSLAQEIASRNVTVNCIAPGFIQSAMTDKLNDKQKDAIMGAIPMRRMGAGEDIAAAALYLASEEAAYVTGQTLHVNGGMAMI